MDNDQIIAEVMRRTGVRIGANDPIFAVVETNRIVLEEVAALLLAEVAPMADGMKTAGREMAQELARVAARRVFTEAENARKELASEADAARNAAAIAINRIPQSNQTDHAVKWIWLGAMVAMIAATIGLILGHYLVEFFNASAPLRH